MTAIIDVKNVTKRFRGQPALAGVSFTVPRGAVFGLLGENGAGKTTLIHTLLGLIKPDAGTTAVLGLESQYHSQLIRQLVGFVPDRPCFYDWMTVDETGWFAAGFRQPGYLDEYRKLIKRFDVPPGQKLRHLSKGMLAKVSLAVALAGEPELLILDEPTSGLDPLVRRDFRLK